MRSSIKLSACFCLRRLVSAGFTPKPGKKNFLKQYRDNSIELGLSSLTCLIGAVKIFGGMTTELY